MAMIAIKCPQCGADIQLDDSREFGFCNYCGTKVMQDIVLLCLSTFFSSYSIL